MAPGTHLDVGVLLLLDLLLGLLAIWEGEHRDLPPLAVLRDRLCALLEQEHRSALAL